jgi:hypothetical protein
MPGSGYSSGGGHSTQRRAPVQASDYDTTSAAIPLWGGWSGARGRIQAEEDARAADANRGYWDELNAPTADALRGDPALRDAQMGALDQMAEWGQGGLTGADRGMLDASRRRDEQAASAQRQAMTQQAQARGIGGSGLDFAMQQSADQQGQQRSSDREAEMMGSAQQRALTAIQQQGQMGSRIREQDASDITSSFDAAATRAAGATNQYSGDTSTRQQGRDRQEAQDESLLGFLGSL